MIPDGHDKCVVVYDYYLEKAFIEGKTENELNQYIETSLRDSNQVCKFMKLGHLKLILVQNSAYTIETP